MEADEAEKVFAASFVTTGVRWIDDLFLGDVVWATDVVPAVNGRTEFFLEVFADVEDSGGQRAKEPFVGVGGEEVDVIDARGECAEALDAVDAKENVPLVQCLADGVEIETIA